MVSWVLVVVESHVWFEDDRLCAVMPALILFDTTFQPLWRMRTAKIVDGLEYTYVCVNAPKSGYAIVRSGKGFGRHGREKYYWVDFDRRVVRRLRHRPTKKLHGGWMSCVELPDSRHVCFEWRDGKLVTASLPL